MSFIRNPVLHRYLKYATGCIFITPPIILGCMYIQSSIDKQTKIQTKFSDGEFNEMLHCFLKE